MSKLQFFEMRANEMCALYDSTFTKKDAIKTGENLIDSVLESGEVDIMQLGANLARLAISSKFICRILLRVLS